MSNKTNIINNFILLGRVLVTMLVSAIVLFSQEMMIEFSAFLGIALFFLLNLFAHELSHIFVAKRKGFKVRSFKFFTLRFYKDGKKIKVINEGFGDQMGETELYPICEENLKDRYKSIAKAGIIANLVLLLISILFMPFWKVFADNDLMILTQLTVFAMPISAYFVLENALPMSSGNYRNDGAIIYGIVKGDPVIDVMLSLMLISVKLYEGKTPSEIDEKYFFNLPQIAEDEPYFIILLNNRYYYYLDKGDYKKAKEIALRLQTLYDYMDKYDYTETQADMLYNYSTFMLNEDEADNIMEDNEKYLNKVFSVRNIRAKLAYALYVLKDNELAKILYNRALSEADKCLISGVKKMEFKLILKMENDIDFSENEAKNAE